MNSENPIVSVIIPTYNRASLLVRSIRSVLAQTWTDFELIIVDDASTDHTQKLVDSFADPRLIYVRHLVNQGGGVARNTGIEQARGEFIAFQDSDDEWFTGRLQRHMECFEQHNEVGAVYSGYLRWDGSQATYVPRHQKILEGDFSNVVLAENLVGTPTLTVRRQHLAKVGGFDETLPRFQDWELIIRLSRECVFSFIREPLLLAHISSDSITINHEARAQALEWILEKHHSLFAEQPKVWSRHAATIGHFRCLCGQCGESLQWFEKSLELRPFSIETRVAKVFAAAGPDVYRFFSEKMVHLLMKIKTLK